MVFITKGRGADINCPDINMVGGVSATIRRTSAGVVVLASPAKKMFHQKSLNDEFYNHQRQNKPMDEIFNSVKKRKITLPYNKRALRIEEIDSSQNGIMYLLCLSFSLCVFVCVACVCVCVSVFVCVSLYKQ